MWLRFAQPLALAPLKRAELYEQLVRREEVGAPQDRHARVIRDARKDYETPRVDEALFVLFGEALSPWPDNCRAAVCLTHDVDRGPGWFTCWARDVWYGATFAPAALLGQKQRTSTIKGYFSLRRSRIDPYDNLARWMELEENLGVRSAFYFLSLATRHLLQEGNRYVISNPAIRRAIREMNSHGWEVGLHARYHDPFSGCELMDQKHRLSDILGADVPGVRNHYLRVRFPESWFLEDECAFLYSSNMGWADTLGGFRAGTCWPYQPIVGSKLWEIPFQMMDSFDLSKDADAFLERFKCYLALVKKYRGVLVLDFHSNYFFEEVAPKVNHVYRSIVGHLRADAELWITTPRNVISRLNALALHNGVSQSLS